MISTKGCILIGRDSDNDELSHHQSADGDMYGESGGNEDVSISEIDNKEPKE